MPELIPQSSPEPENPLWSKRAAQFPKATIIPLASFNNQYAGRTCYIIGRGPTDFSFLKLQTIPDPIFFINDAVCLESYAHSETFFFAHDASMLVWLDGTIRATAILPFDGKLFPENSNTLHHHAGRLAFYHWQKEDARPVLRLDRAKVAATAELYRHGATIHSLLHFVWFCGFQHVNFIGCDGLNDRELLGSAYHAPTGYNPRLENRSRTVPWWQYDAIRSIQDSLCAHLGLQTEYLGTPRPTGFAAIRKFILFNPRNRNTNPASAPGMGATWYQHHEQFNPKSLESPSSPSPLNGERVG